MVGDSRDGLRACRGCTACPKALDVPKAFEDLCEGWGHPAKGRAVPVLDCGMGLCPYGLDHTGLDHVGSCQGGLALDPMGLWEAYWDP